ncbi:MAG: ABC transporter permease [Candidatus Zixiibacteriota bacterium]|nr:MAG: ABC transporter permease [candidate division Zixibacteria bacterium]
MIRHAFKMIWNRKRRNSLLIIEIFFSFMVLFAVGAKVISDLNKFRQPLGFEYENVRVLYPGWHAVQDTMSPDEMKSILSQVARELSCCPEVELISCADGNIPFRNARFGTTFNYEGQDVSLDFTYADDEFASVLNIPLAEGRWFSREDDGSSMRPVVISRKLKDEVFGDEPVVGTVITGEKYDRVIVGVIDKYLYRGELMEYRYGFFQRRVFPDTTDYLPDLILFKVRPDAGYQFEAQLLKRLTSMTHGWPVRIESLADKRAEMLKDYMWGIATVGLVAGFLVLNVALGLFGILWYSINRRRGEIGLRRAIGATMGKISTQVLFEALVLATFGIIAGIFVAAQAPIIGIDDTIGVPVYVIAMAYSALMIYLIVTVCALYPSRLAARVQPAEALHDE